ncbi:hypothetical protein QYE76_025957 [Lolium multiflorum]|uniref:Integrase catalytic domain-containing protein n=1 Tax=Lolium multiflorum TaxID=4521 RepID=A0AAD8RGK3_LOLMU|nr:hypothetical protein QYE76_025957 [Lolium multiflorum]
MIQEVMRHQYSPSGPALGTYQGEVPLQSRPPLPFALAAPEVPNSPAYAVDMVEDMYPGRCQPRYSFNINMVELGHRPGKGRDEGSCSHGEDKEEAVPRDRPRHCQKILVMIKMKVDSSDRSVLSVPPALPVCGVDLTGDGKLGTSDEGEILEEVKKEIEKMLAAGFIRPCRYAEWISSIVPVEKKDGRWRVAIDFRDLNRATPKDEYPMPVAETLINAAAGHKVLSFMDGNTGYNQIFMAPEDIHKTAFRVPGAVGLFEYVVMTFGLKNAGATYQRAMNYIFHDLIDYFTKWVEAVPMKKVKSEDVIKFVKEHVIHRFGIPQTITTDGGSVFISKEFRKFCDDLGMLIRSSPYYAQANGQAEASNQSLIKLIKRKIDENPRDWHEKLSEALWAYRMSCHGAIKTSPYQLVYGQEAVLPWEITAGSRRVTFQNDLTAEEYAALMSDTIEDATELRLWSLEKIKENKARVARAYNKKVRPKEFQVGDLVWEAVLPLGTRDKAYGKWSPNWHGPYKVVQALKGNAYMLEQLDGVKFPVAVNGQHLKKYFPSMWDDGQ